MNKMFTLAALVFSMTGHAQQNFDTVKIRPFKITDNIYMLKGSGGNIGVLIGKDGTLIVDSQFAPLSNRINGAIRTLDPGEIRFLINTHLHGDHSGGNDNFKRIGATIVAHDNVRERMMKQQVNPARNLNLPPRERDALPIITVASTINFHLNDEDIEIFHTDPGHTDGDMVVHFIKANVYHLGDIFTRTGYPFIDVSSGGSLTGYIANLDKMLAVLDDNSRVIPGHGNVGTKADVKIFRDKIVDIRDQVIAALKKGKKVEEIPGLGITDKYEAELGKGFIKGKDFVLLVADAVKPPVKTTKSK